MSNLLTKLKKLQRKGDVIPKHCRTTTQWAAKWNVTKGVANQLIKEGLKSGLMKQVSYRVVCADRVMRLPHYFEVTK